WQLHAKNLHRSAVPRKLSLLFFFHDRLSCHHLSPVSFPHEEGARARFFMKLPMPSVRCPLRVALRRPGRGGWQGTGAASLPATGAARSKASPPEGGAALGDTPPRQARAGARCDQAASAPLPARREGAVGHARTARRAPTQGSLCGARGGGLLPRARRPAPR